MHFPIKRRCLRIRFWLTAYHRHRTHNLVDRDLIRVKTFQDTQTQCSIIFTFARRQDLIDELTTGHQLILIIMTAPLMG